MARFNRLILFVGHMQPDSLCASLASGRSDGGLSFMAAVITLGGRELWIRQPFRTAARTRPHSPFYVVFDFKIHFSGMFTFDTTLHV